MDNVNLSHKQSKAEKNVICIKMEWLSTRIFQQKHSMRLLHVFQVKWKMSNFKQIPIEHLTKNLNIEFEFIGTDTNEVYTDVNADLDIPPGQVTL